MGYFKLTEDTGPIYHVPDGIQAGLATYTVASPEPDCSVAIGAASVLPRVRGARAALLPVVPPSVRISISFIFAADAGTSVPGADGDQ